MSRLLCLDIKIHRGGHHLGILSLFYLGYVILVYIIFYIMCQRSSLTHEEKFMSGRDYKPNYEGAYFHTYNRGVNKSLIFLDDQDYDNFIYRAKLLLGLAPLPRRNRSGTNIRLKPLLRGSLEILSYCLMPNHFHFLIKQNKFGAQRAFFQRLCTSYSIYFNKKYKRVGHIFQVFIKQKMF